MLLGKRPRPPMKRTTSMSEISLDLNTSADVPAIDPNNPFNEQRGATTGGFGPWKRQGGPNGGLDCGQRVLATVSPRNPRRHSTDFLETADFLRACSLCKRPLVPNRDIYMYRGDSAFCSLECRQQQMNQDERKEKCTLASKKQVAVAAAASGSQVTSTKGETVVAL